MADKVNLKPKGGYSYYRGSYIVPVNGQYEAIVVNAGYVKLTAETPKKLRKLIDAEWDK